MGRSEAISALSVFLYTCSRKRVKGTSFVVDPELSGSGSSVELVFINLFSASLHGNEVCLCEPVLSAVYCCCW